ncbi:MAG: hypothetical protein EOO51_00190 [Flavobacterium sp.]|nr:MAG: hypothetical protein EOO51_00190 [Flavobacterium sp.]
MKKIKTTSVFVIIIILKCISGVGQTLEIPKIDPPSPEAYLITKYGDIPVNEFTGVVTANVPVYTFRAGKLVYPITLNYMGAGVKVDQLPSWVGMNWSLNGVSVITRTVRDIADEETNDGQRYYLSDAEINEHLTNLNDGTTNAAYFNDLGHSTDIDSEVDVFNFSIPGYSGGFFLDQNFTPILTKKESEIRITVNGPSADNKENLRTIREFRITAPDGVQYTFGGSGFLEQTALRTTTNGIDGSEHTQGFTAYYLKKITHPARGDIIFEYDQVAEQIMTPITKEESQNYNLHEITFWTETGCLNKATESHALTTIITRTIGPKYLRKIYCPEDNSSIIFNSDFVAIDRLQRKLNSIEVYKDSLLTDKIEFTYFIDLLNASQTRFFLTKVTFNKQLEVIQEPGRKYEEYNFAYNDPGSLPDRFSASQDIDGYYNGKVNTTLLTDNIICNPNHLPGFADRKPDFFYGSKGVLTDIYYPTGGRTHFDYEAEQVKRDICNDGFSLVVWRNSDEINPNLLGSTWPEIDIDNENQSYVSPINQDVQFNLHFEVTQSHVQRDHVRLKIVEDNNLTILDETENLGDYGPPKDFHYIRHLQAGHSYRVFLEIVDLPLGTHYATASVSSQLCTGVERVSGYGVRLLRQEDFASEDGPPSSVKRFYYTNINKTLVPTIDLPYLHYVANIKKGLFVENCVTEGPGAFTGETVWTYDTLSSASFENFFSIKQPGDYSTVSISYGGDLFELGGTEKSFKTERNVESLISLYTSPNWYMQFVDPINLINISPVNGTLERETTYENHQHTLRKITEKTYHYTYHVTSSANNIQCSQKFNIIYYLPGQTISNVITNHQVGMYHTSAWLPTLDTIRTVQYIDPIPLGTTDESIYRRLQTDKSFTYDSYAGLPTEIRESTSKADEQLVTRNVYAKQVDQLTGVSQEEIIALGALDLKNIIQQPVQVTTYLSQSGTLNPLSTQRTVYKIFPSCTVPLPQKIQFSKTSPSGSGTLEDRVEFKAYDVGGNPTVISLKNGANIKYIYNKWGQPQVKIENFPDSQPLDTTLDEEIAAALEENGSSFGQCSLQASYPNSLVTVYVRNSYKELIQIIDPKCLSTFYEYDAFHRLKRVRNDEGNIVKEFDYNFKRYTIQP